MRFHSAVAILALTLAQPALSQSADPRVGLRGGWKDAAEASMNMTLIAHRDRPDGFFTPTDPGAFPTANSDLAFSGNNVFQGSFHGFQIWDISNPANPALRLAYACPGGQGDVSVYRNLLFVSVQESLSRMDCAANGDTASAPNTERFRGVRIFDISDLAHPRQVAEVQTCRGSHTHTLVTDPNDRANIYVYVSGTSPPRPAAELAGCSGGKPGEDPATSLFRIDIIRVPLAAPQNARVIASPRIFANEKGNIAGLLMPVIDTSLAHHPSETSRCHDITAYPAIGLAAGACAGNGILLDIRNPAAPKRVAAVADSNFAFWHSATFNNAGDKVIFTDEWGGGTQAKCRATDDPEWGADAIFTRKGNKLTMASYYKLPAAQTEQENCVAHNGSLIPVPGRDIFVQAWYQGGVSVIDFTDAAHPKEIAYFDRGPVDSTKILLAGEWSAYWYNGHIYGSEIARGLDVFDLKPSEYLSQSEIDAAKSATVATLNVQNQQRMAWPPSVHVAQSYLDQLNREKAISGATYLQIANDIRSADKYPGGPRRSAFSRLALQVERDTRRSKDPARARALAASLRSVANAGK
ncbi:MAG: hypothetical protein M3Z17_06080 [Gemmatimonadota bacterium]|nr:hypothetical protein [Gemmatimonadota bacterium]